MNREELTGNLLQAYDEGCESRLNDEPRGQTVYPNDPERQACWVAGWDDTYDNGR